MMWSGRTGLVLVLAAGALACAGGAAAPAPAPPAPIEPEARPDPIPEAALEPEMLPIPDTLEPPPPSGSSRPRVAPRPPGAPGSGEASPYPSAEELDQLGEAPGPEQVFGLDVRRVERWRLRGPFPDRIGALPWEGAGRSIHPKFDGVHEGFLEIQIARHTNPLCRQARVAAGR